MADDFDVSSEEEEEEETEEEEEAAEEVQPQRPARAGLSNQPVTRIRDILELQTFAGGASARRIFSPNVSRYEYAVLLRQRVKDLGSLTREELYTSAGVPPNVLDEIAEQGKARVVARLTHDLRQVEARIPAGQAWSEEPPAGQAMGEWELAQRYPAAHARRLREALERFEAADGPIDALEVARAEWLWRKRPGYGMPYVFQRFRPDGSYEIWLMHQLENSA